jgi:hypothetical protein
VSVARHDPKVADPTSEFISKEPIDISRYECKRGPEYLRKNLVLATNKLLTVIDTVYAVRESGVTYKDNRE